MLQAPPPPGVRPLSGQDRPRYPGASPSPPDRRQLCDPQARRRAALALTPSALPHPLPPAPPPQHRRAHLPPASGLNMVERLLADPTCRRLRRGCFRSVAELKSAIRRYLNDHNAAPKPFVWTKGADTIIRKYERAKRNLISRAGH